MIENIIKINALSVKNLYKDKDIYSSYPNASFYINDANNSNGFFCDEFVKDHIGKHILFSGCSVTAGSGLDIEDVWSMLLYKKLNKSGDCSGYFNLAIPGNGIINQIANLFKYFKTYGNPNLIFICIPNMERFYFFNKKNNIIQDSFYNDEELNFIKVFVYQYYSMLEQYCKTNNIQLYSFSWDLNKNNFSYFFSSMFESFYDIDKKDLETYLINNSKNNKYALVAKDKIHFGTEYHKYWYNFIYKKYLENNDNSRN